MMAVALPRVRGRRRPPSRSELLAILWCGLVVLFAFREAVELFAYASRGDGAGATADALGLAFMWWAWTRWHVGVFLRAVAGRALRLWLWGE